MIRKISSYLLLFLSLFIFYYPQVNASPKDITISVSLDRDTIGMDEQATLQVVISGSVQNLPAPRIPTLPMFEVYSQGRSSNISIVNGQVSSSLTYQYLLLPQKPGIFPISHISMVYNNKRYEGNTVELTVLNNGTATTPKLSYESQGKNGQKKDYFLEAVVDKKNPYVNEQVTLTLKFYITVQYYGSPQLSEPTTTGFWTEVLGNKTPYYQRVGNRNYKVVERQYALFPTQTGKLTIGRAAIKTTVAIQSRNRDPFSVFGNIFNQGRNVTIRSRPVTIDVKPLPEKGKPKNFSGTIGKFNISATANKYSVEVNQPVSVTVKISGTGNIKSVAEPVMPQLTDFRIYKESSNENIAKQNGKISGTKIYKEVFIPKRPGKLQIPSIGFNYFDPQQSKYKKIATRPINLNVIKPEGYTTSTELPYPSPEIVIGSKINDIRYIKNKIGKTSPIGSLTVTSPLYVIINGLPVMIFVGLVFIRRRREKLNADIGYARSRIASKMARKRLAKAKSMANIKTGSDFYAEIYNALISYIADKLNISPYGLTIDKVKELLGTKTQNPLLIDDVIGLFQKCDYVRYAPSSITQEDIDQALQKAEKIMIAFEEVKFV